MSSSDRVTAAVPVGFYICTELIVTKVLCVLCVHKSIMSSPAPPSSSASSSTLIFHFFGLYFSEISKLFMNWVSKLLICQVNARSSYIMQSNSHRRCVLDISIYVEKGSCGDDGRWYVQIFIKIQTTLRIGDYRLLYPTRLFAMQHVSHTRNRRRLWEMGTKRNNCVKTEIEFRVHTFAAFWHLAMDGPM